MRFSSDPYAASCTSACLNVYVAVGGAPRTNISSASTRRASPCCNALSSSPAVAASNAYENSLPSTAARCATCAGEAIEPRQQRVLQRDWDLRYCRIASRFHHRLCQLLDEERDAVGAGNELLHHDVGQRPCRAHRGDHLPHLSLGEPAERQRLQVRASRPGVYKLRPRRADQQDMGRGTLRHQASKQFQG